jgi:hypothetical protein
MCIINGYFSPTYKNPHGFSIWGLFAKLDAKSTQLTILKPNPIHKRCMPFESNIKD